MSFRHFAVVLGSALCATALSVLAQPPAVPNPAPAAAPPAPASVPLAPASAVYASAAIKEPALLNPKSPEYNSLRQAKTKVLNGTTPFSEGKADLDRWYDHFFRAFTVVQQPAVADQENSKEQVTSLLLPDKRKEICTDLAAAYGRPDVHKHLSDKTLNICRMLVAPKGNYHPAVRYNAMLLIGDLNRKEPTAQSRFPDPSPAALAIMIEELKNPQQIDAVKIAALIGITRHIQLDRIPGKAERMVRDDQMAVYQQMLALITSETPHGRSKEGHEWMQRRAIEILEMMGIIDDSNPVLTAVEGMVADGKRGMALRCTAARSLKAIDAKSKATFNPQLSAYHLAVLAGDACKAELTYLEKINKKAAMMAGGIMGGDAYPMGSMGPTSMGAASMPTGGPGMGMGMGMSYGGSGGFDVPADPRVVPVQRRLVPEMLCVQDGIKGLSIVAKNDAEKSSLADIEREVATVLKHLMPEKEKTEKGKTGAPPPPPDPRKATIPLTVEAVAKELKKRADALDRISSRLAPPELKKQDVDSDLDLPGGTLPAAPGPEKAAAAPSQTPKSSS